MVSASARGRSNQRKGGYHECKQGNRLGELTGFTFERNLEQRREANLGLRLVRYQKPTIKYANTN